MFRIISIKQLGLTAFIICILFIAGTALNIIAPYANTIPKDEVCVPIIMYHQICENSAVLGDYAITKELLDKDFMYIKDKGYTPISFKQLRNYTENKGMLPHRPIVITFDDGQRSFITKVLPLLEKYNYPANVNIIGSLTRQYTENGDTNDSYAYLNEDDIKILSRHRLVEIGYHSYNLHSLKKRKGMGKLSYEKEILYEKTIIDDIKLFNSYYKELTNQSTYILAYPYGIKNKKLDEITDNFGYKIKLTCREAVNIISVGSSLSDLGRFNRPYKESTEGFFDRILQ